MRHLRQNTSTLSVSISLNNMLDKTFKNQDLNLNDLPDYQKTETRFINSKYIKILRLQIGFLVLPVFIFIVCSIYFQFDLPQLFWYIFIPTVSLVLSLWLIEVEAGFKKRTFGLRDHDIYFSKGFFVHKETVLPFKRIQHVEVIQGIFLRWQNLYAIKLYTAGASSGDLAIYGLDKETASKIKAYVMQQNFDLSDESTS